MDQHLPDMMSDFIMCVLSVIFLPLLIAFTAPWFIAAIIPICAWISPLALLSIQNLNIHRNFDVIIWVVNSVDQEVRVFEPFAHNDTLFL